MIPTKIILAKYIADLHRFEPRNVGVIVWSPLGIEARFLAEHPTRAGEVDGRSIPEFVTSVNAYRQWVSFWRSSVGSDSITSLKSGERVSAISPHFPAVLTEMSKGNFVLSEAGSAVDDISASELGDLANQLYSQLVEERVADEPKDIRFSELCDSLIKRSNLISHGNFRNQFKVRCKTKGQIDEEYTFSHAIANGKLERAYQRFPIPKATKSIQKNRDATAWMFDNLITNGLITPDKLVLLTDVTAEQQSQPDVEKTFSLLGAMSKIVNIRREDEALLEFAIAAQIPVH